MLLATPHLYGLSHTEGCRYAHRGVACTKRVVAALGHTWETADALTLTVGEEGVTTLGDNLMGVGLMADIPDYAVERRVIDIVQSYGELHCSEARAQVAWVLGTTGYDVVPKFGAVVPKFGNGESS